MAAHTLSPNRDLNQSELNTLEAMVDATGIEAVIQGLSEICGLEADRIAHSWQDTILAKRWATLEGALNRLHKGNPISEAAYGARSHAASNLNHGKPIMAEANDSVHLTKLRTRLGMAVMVLARQRAIKAAKRQFHAQGLKPQYMPLPTDR